MTQIYTKTLHVQKLYFRIFGIYIKGHLNQSNRKKYQTSEVLLVLPVVLACFKKNGFVLYHAMAFHLNVKFHWVERVLFTKHITLYI